MPKIHELKSWPQFFRAIKDGSRTHELRRNDRDFNIGDVLILQEFDPDLQHYTGDVLNVEVTSITSFAQPCAVSGAALDPSFCILSVRPAKIASFPTPPETFLRATGHEPTSA